MGFLTGNSIRSRIIMAIMLVAIPMILITSIILATFTIKSFKQAQMQYALSSANFVVSQAAVAMLFDDNSRGNEILKNYETEDGVDAAFITYPNGKVFAKLVNDAGVDEHLIEHESPYVDFDNGHLYVNVDIVSDGVTYGTLYLILNTKRLSRTILIFTMMVLFTIIIVTVITYVWAKHSQKSISAPIINLTEFAKTITSGNEIDSIKRIRIDSNDEISELYTHFNDMLDKIDDRDKDLRSVSELFQDVINSTPSLLVVFDRNGEITLSNRIVEDVTGLDGVIDRSIWEVFPQLEDYRKIINEVISSKESKELRSVAFELNDIKRVDLTVYPLSRDVYDGTVLLISDVTSVNEQEQMFIQIQKMETIGTLAGGLAHDFNNVMAGIVGTLSLMELQVDNGISKEELLEDIDILKSTSDRAVNMVGQLLSLSHKSDTKLDYINLVDSVKNVVRLLGNSIDKSVLIKTEYSSDNLLLLGDGVQLEQIILNIAINGAHAMTLMRESEDDYGGELKIGVKEVSIGANFSKGIPEGIYHNIEITDSGVGISDKVIKKMFDPFFTTKDKGSGTGLGLSMVFSLVKKHGGYVTVDSKIGEGSTFNLFFPKVENDKNEIKNKTNSKDYLNNTGEILIIDDESEVRFVASKMLEKAGYTVFCKENGDSGIEYYKDNLDSIDLVLLDMVMPGISGEEVYGRLREIDSTIPILLSSGFEQDERVQRLIDIGVDGFIHKPYSLVELVKKVGSIIG